MGRAGGRGRLLSLRQKDAGQHFICNHLNVFAVFRIQNSCWGCLGGGVRRASICPVGCTVAADWGGAATADKFATTSPGLCCLGAHLEGLLSGSPCPLGP